MLYIEDFLELIEPFPQELRERLTEMREIDLKIQNETDKLDTRIDSFFFQCRRQKNEWKSENFEEIRKEYMKLIESADDKIQIGNQLYDLIEKYIKKLDQELQKFKLELEADHAGITSKLEQVISSKANVHGANAIGGGGNTLAAYNNSTLSGINFNLNQLNDESDFTLCAPGSSSNAGGAPDLALMMMMSSQSSTGAEFTPQSSHNKRKHSTSQQQQSAAAAAAQNDEDSCSSWQSTLYQGRKSSVSAGGGVSSSGNKKTTSFNTAYNKQSSFLSQNNNPKRVRLDTSSSTNKRNKISPIDEYTYTDENDGEMTNQEDDDQFQGNDYDEEDNGGGESNAEGEEDENEERPSSHVRNYGLQRGAARDHDDEDDDEEEDEIGFYRRSRPVNSVLDDDDSNQEATINSVANELGLIKRKQCNGRIKDDWKDSGEDTNERYCICKDVSYGEMIMCDNPKCETQWFHFVCVGLSSAPKGKWYCPMCTELKKKRREKQLNAIANFTSQHSILGLQSSNAQTSFQSQQDQPTSITSFIPFLSSSNSNNS